MSYEYAEHAIAQGYKIIPVNPNTKAPYLSAGFEYSNDLEQVATWWGEYPDAVVGIGLKDSGVVVVDIDNHEGKVSGFDTANKLGLRFATTYVYKSFSGKGEHHWYPNPDITTTGKLDGIDIKVTGYVIANYFVPSAEELYVPLPDEYRPYKSNVGEGKAWEGSVKDWLDIHSDIDPVAYEVTSLVEELRVSGFTGNEFLFKKMIRLVHLANDGKGGVPEAMRELYTIWKNSPHSSGNAEAEFLRAMHRAILMLGGGKVEKTEEQIANEKEQELLARAEVLAEQWEVTDLAKRLRAQKYATGTREYSWTELDEMRVDWIVDGYLAFGNNSMLCGAPNIGKTFLYIDWMCSSVAGIKWAGRETKKAKFLVVIGEGMTGWSDRIKAWCDEHMEDYEEIRKSIIPFSQASLASDSDIDLLAEVVRERGVDMVIFDTWNTNSGLSDENSNGETALSLNAMSRLQTGVLIIHHPNSETATQTPTKLKPRGATALAGKMDFIVTMFQSNKEPRHSGSGSQFITASTLDENGGKSRHSERMSIQGLWLKDVNKTKVMVYDDGNINTNVNKFFATALKDGPKTLKELVDWSASNWEHNGKFGVKGATITRWSKEADPERLVISKGQHNKISFSWTEPTLPGWDALKPPTTE